MKKKSFETGSSYWGLKCPNCGNEDIFLEEMAYEYHEVDGRLNYLHLVSAETAEYRCSICDEVVEPTNHPFQE
jgi:DNA-directed RNA polymerase subunit RPC12/RpoP